MLGALLVLPVRCLVMVIRCLPVDWAANLGRCFGGLAWWIDRRHRRVALDNLRMALGSTHSGTELTALAREHFRRLGENYVSAIRLAGMPAGQLRKRFEVAGLEKHLPTDGRGLILAVGHFGNFELYARIIDEAPGWVGATTYRALRQPALNRLMQELRGLSSIRYFERRTEAAAIQTFLQGGKAMLGLLADQHAGDKGHWVEFFGRGCSCSAAPAVYALRYGCDIAVAICHRKSLARYRIEIGPSIATRNSHGVPRESSAITEDIQRAYETAIRRDPANWFWVHRRWKPPSKWQNKGDGNGSETAGSPPGAH